MIIIKHEVLELGHSAEQVAECDICAEWIRTELSLRNKQDNDERFTIFIESHRGCAERMNRKFEKELEELG